MIFIATTYVYLNEEELEQLVAGEKIEIAMTDLVRQSDRMFVLKKVVEEKESK